MNLQFSFLLVFICGAVSTWLLIKTSNKVFTERKNIIKEKIKSIGGALVNVEQIQEKEVPFAGEYKNINLSYKFYKINYYLDNKRKEGWTVLEMKQNWHGPSGAIKTSWVWIL